MHVGAETSGGKHLSIFYFIFSLLLNFQFLFFFSFSFLFWNHFNKYHFETTQKKWTSGRKKVLGVRALNCVYRIKLSNWKLVLILFDWPNPNWNLWTTLWAISLVRWMNHLISVKLHWIKQFSNYATLVYAVQWNINYIACCTLIGIASSVCLLFKCMWIYSNFQRVIWWTSFP